MPPNHVYAAARSPPPPRCSSMPRASSAADTPSCAATFTPPAECRIPRLNMPLRTCGSAARLTRRFHAAFFFFFFFFHYFDAAIFAISLADAAAARCLIIFIFR
jgi:hypothetical protein